MDNRAAVETPSTRSDSDRTEKICPTSSDDSFQMKEKKVDSDVKDDQDGSSSPLNQGSTKRQARVEGAQSQKSKKEEQALTKRQASFDGYQGQKTKKEEQGWTKRQASVEGAYTEGQKSKMDGKWKKSRNQVETSRISKTLKNEVNRAPQIIARGRIVHTQENSRIIRCDDLETDNPLKDLEITLSPVHPWAGNFLQEVVIAMFKTLRDTKEMEEISRRYQHQKLECGKDGKLYGVEILFIVKGLQHPTATSHHSNVHGDGTSNPIMIIAYRILVKVLEGNPEDLPKNSELELLDI